MTKKTSTNKKGKKKNNIEAKKIKTTKAKTKKTKETKAKQEEKNEFSRLVKIILIVTAIFAVFYVVTIIVTNKAEEAKAKEETKTGDEEKEEVDIQYRDIMIGTMLNQGGTYYVLIQDKDEIRSDEYNALVTAVSSNEDSPSIYRANLTDTFNKKYLSKEENYYVDDISKFKVKGTTLIKVVDGKVDAAFDNYDAIKNKLTELS